MSNRRPPIKMAMLGDSTAAGYGVHRAIDTPAVRIAIAVSAAARRPVHLTNTAAVGAESTWLLTQVDELVESPDLTVVIVGANDVTHRIKPAISIRALSDAVTTLRGRGCEVVVATCPDLGTIRPIAQPLRYFARRLSRSLAAAQTIAVVEAGGRTVSLGDLLGPSFATRADLFSEDRFHPSAAGYAAAAEAILPSCLDALGAADAGKVGEPLHHQTCSSDRSGCRSGRRPPLAPRSPRPKCTARRRAGEAAGRNCASAAPSGQRR